MSTRFTRRAICAVIIAGSATLSASFSANAQPSAYPAKPIRMVLGFPPGGPTDIVARIVGQKMSEQLGQPVIVDNKPGVGGNIAAEIVAKAPADGYTILYNTSSITISPWVYTKVNFDPLKDFTPVTTTAEMPLVLLVNPAVPAKTTDELVRLMKANPGKYNYGSSGVGAIEHLTSALFLSNFGLKASHIPYKGTAPALTDLIAGRTQFMLTTMNTAIPFVRDGKLRALGVTSLQRSHALPSVPTLAEAMKTEFASTAWQGIVLPPGAPTDVVSKLNQVVNGIMKDPGVVQKLADQGVATLGDTPDQYKAFIQKEFARWQVVVKESGAKAE